MIFDLAVSLVPFDLVSFCVCFFKKVDAHDTAYSHSKQLSTSCSLAAPRLGPSPGRMKSHVSNAPRIKLRSQLPSVVPRLQRMVRSDLRVTPEDCVETLGIFAEHILYCI